MAKEKAQDAAAPAEGAKGPAEKNMRMYERILFRLNLTLHSFHRRVAGDAHAGWTVGQATVFGLVMGMILGLLTAVLAWPSWALS